MSFYEKEGEGIKYATVEVLNEKERMQIANKLLQERKSLLSDIAKLSVQSLKDRFLNADFNRLEKSIAQYVKIKKQIEELPADLLANEKISQQMEALTNAEARVLQNYNSEKE